jgi:hypothetical protein
MKTVLIDGKEYLQQEDSDIDRLPAQVHSRDMLKPKNLLKENEEMIIKINQDEYEFLKRMCTRAKSLVHFSGNEKDKKEINNLIMKFGHGFECNWREI